MSAALSAVTRERLRRFFRIVRFAACVGAASGVVIAGSIAAPGMRSLLATLLTAVPIGVIVAVLLAVCIAGIEMFLLPRPSMRWLDALPFAAVFALKTLVYGGIAAAVLIGQPGERLMGVVTVYDMRSGLIAVALSLVPVAVVVILFQAAGLVGYRTFMALLFGKYRRPFAERRFFLFVDVIGSTTIAERLGALEAHKFLAAVFSATAEPIAASKGEIYQYVGDEIVVTWTEEEGTSDARPLRCFFLMEAVLLDMKEEFRTRFAAEPALRAALHLGEVIAGEIGEQRRAIVYHGDVMNTASRLEQATRDAGVRFIASDAAIGALQRLPELAYKDLGPLALRGRKEPIRAWAVELNPT
jgi:adenylate cyclase